MKYFLHEDFLLQNKAARRLYHEYAKEMPIIDYHCHLPPARIAEDKPFPSLTDIWLSGDHYKWRAMRTLGIAEKFITGDADDEARFIQWARAVPYTLRNPLYDWTHMELKNPFGVEEYLDGENASRIYHHCSELLQQPSFSPRNLIRHHSVELVVTTDDPCDDLAYHRRIEASGFDVKVLPCFRPDRVFQLAGGDAFRQFIRQLSEASGTVIRDIASLLEALSARVDYFHRHHARISDHGLQYIPSFNNDHIPDFEKAFISVLNGHDEDAARWTDEFAGYVLYELSKMYHSKGWVQQFHLGALRNNSTRTLLTVGPETGFDSVGDDSQAMRLRRFLDRLDKTDQLCQTILYNINPSYNEVFATLAGSFNDGSIKGKMQFGAAWWFLDQKDGMEKQLNALSQMGLISCFIGMVTDSRSFLSYSRHEYFRRILCNMFGEDIEKGLLPGDMGWIGKLVQDICYHNAKAYFNF